MGMSSTATSMADTTSAGAVRVALVEDDRRLLSSLRLLIGGSPGFDCVAAVGSVEEALRSVLAEPPEVVLLDIGLPGLRGSVGVAHLLEHWPGAIFLMHTAFEDDDLVFESLQNGASGYVLKRTMPARLLDAILEAHRGGSPMSPEIARKVIVHFRRIAPPTEPVERLSPQETRLLRGIAEGLSYKEAATELGVSINTVRAHIRSIYDKLSVHTKSEAVSKAMRSGQI